MGFESVELTSSNIPDEYTKRVAASVSEVVRELRKIGYGWDALCNFAYKAANDGVYEVETDEIYDVMKH
jgi:hypothetical protein